MIRKISGKQSAQKINHLHVNGAEVTDVSDIVNTLGETFSDNSSSDHCSTSFKSYKQNAEKCSISFSNNTETYNNPFSMDELTNAISKSHVAAVGPDSIHYQMLKNLPDFAMDTLLSAVNYIWTTGNFPPEWHLATVIPIAKPGKDSTDPTSYRPIALTSCLCKVMTRLVFGKAQTYPTSPKWFQETTQHNLFAWRLLFVRHLSINSTLLQYFLILRRPMTLLGNMVS